MVRRAGRGRARRLGAGAAPRRRRASRRTASRRPTSSSPCSCARSRGSPPRRASTRARPLVALGRALRPAREPARPARGRPARARRLDAAGCTVVGSTNLDLVARRRAAAAAGRDGHRRDVRAHPGREGREPGRRGGAARRRVRFVGCVGRRRVRRRGARGARDAGVELDACSASDEPTGVALIFVDAAGENRDRRRAGRERGAAARAASASTARRALPARDPARGRVAAAAEQASFFCLNAAPARPVDAEVVARCDLIVVNRYELDALPEPPRPARAHARRRGRGAARGRGGGRARTPPAVDAVDGTAAGDAFTACLVVSLLEGRDRDEALRRACAAGAIAASRAGAQPSLPTAPRSTRYSPADADVSPHTAAPMRFQGNAGTAARISAGQPARSRRLLLVSHARTSWRPRAMREGSR